MMISGLDRALVGSKHMLTLRSTNDTHCIVIGLINNMPDGALRLTEQQFCGLLSAATHNCTVCVRFFSLPGLPHVPDVQSYLDRHYEGIDELWEGRFDGLIVTGAEPRTAELSDESYWPVLAKLVDWAEEHTTSTVWSCLAAYAAVLQSDGIRHRHLRDKLFGLYDCTKASDHPILAGAASGWRIPHSRYDDLPEDALAAGGYGILSRSGAGADMFVKQRKSLFVFLQGHPEYDNQALLREYHRDIRRFLNGESESYPEMPRGYFSDGTADALAELRTRALRERNLALLRHFPAVPPAAKCDWRELAICFYTNWISYLTEGRYQKGRRLASNDAAELLRRASRSELV